MLGRHKSGGLEIPRGSTDAARIEAEFRSALRVENEQGAVALELRAATGLANWLAEHHRRGDGKEVLSPVYRKITEGFETPDMRAARLLLEEFG